MTDTLTSIKAVIKIASRFIQSPLGFVTLRFDPYEVRVNICFHA